EAEETLSIGQDAARAGVLHDSGLSAREVAEGSVADPCVRERHTGGLHAAELASRLLDVRAVPLGRRTDLPGLADLPSERFHSGTPLFVVLGEADGELKPCGRPRGKVRIFEERDVLLLVDGPTLELKCAAPPVRDRCVR